MMRLPFKAWIIFSAVGCLVISVLGCPSRWHPIASKEERLLDRIDQYYNVLQTKAYEDSTGFHAHSRPQTPKKPSNLASQLSLEMLSYEVQSMQLNDQDAQVVMLVTIAEHHRHYDLVMIDHWQFVGDNWYVVDADKPVRNANQPNLHPSVWQGAIQW